MLAEIALFTPDVHATVAFYERLLDRPPLSRWGGGATFDIGDITLLIHEQGDPAQGMPPGVDHFAFRVADVDTEAARLGAEAKDYPWGRSAYLHDPDGRLVELQ